MAEPEDDEGWLWGLGDDLAMPGLGAALGGVAGFGLEQWRPSPIDRKALTIPAIAAPPPGGNYPAPAAPRGIDFWRRVPDQVRDPLNPGSMLPKTPGATLRYPVGTGNSVPSSAFAGISRLDRTQRQMARDVFRDNESIGYSIHVAGLNAAADADAAREAVRVAERELDEFTQRNPYDEVRGGDDPKATEREDLRNALTTARNQRDAAERVVTQTTNPRSTLGSQIGAYQSRVQESFRDVAERRLRSARSLKQFGIGAAAGGIMFAVYDQMDKMQQEAIDALMADRPSDAPSATRDDLAHAMSIYNQYKLGQVSLEDLDAGDVAFLEVAATYVRDPLVIDALSAIDIDGILAREAQAISSDPQMPDYPLGDEVPLDSGMPGADGRDHDLDMAGFGADMLPDPDMAGFGSDVSADIGEELFNNAMIAANRERAAMGDVQDRIDTYNEMDALVDYGPDTFDRDPFLGLPYAGQTTPQADSDGPEMPGAPRMGGDPGDLAIDDGGFGGDFDPAQYLDPVIDYETGTFAGVSPEGVATSLLNRPRDDARAIIEGMSPADRGRLLEQLGPYGMDVVDAIESGQSPRDLDLRAMVNFEQPIPDDGDMPLFADGALPPGMTDVGDFMSPPADMMTFDMDSPDALLGELDAMGLGGLYGPSVDDAGRLMAGAELLDEPIAEESFERGQSPIPLLTSQSMQAPLPYDFTGERSTFTPYELGTPEFEERARIAVAGGGPITEQVIRFGSVMDVASMLAGGRENITEDHIQQAMQVSNEGVVPGSADGKYFQEDRALDRGMEGAYDFVTQDAVPALTWGAGQLANPIVNAAGYLGGNVLSAINGDGFIPPSAYFEQVGDTYDDINEAIYPEDGSDGFNLAYALGAPEDLDDIPGMAMEAFNDLNHIRQVGDNEYQDRTMLDFLNYMEGQNAGTEQFDAAADLGLPNQPEVSMTPPILDEFYPAALDDEEMRNVSDMINSDPTVRAPGGGDIGQTRPTGDDEGGSGIAGTFGGVLDALEGGLGVFDNLIGSPAEAGTELTDGQIDQGAESEASWRDTMSSAALDLGTVGGLYAVAGKIPFIGGRLSRGAKLAGAGGITFGSDVAAMPGEFWDWATRNADEQGAEAQTADTGITSPDVDPELYPTGETIDGTTGPSDPQLAAAAVNPETAPALASAAQQIEAEAEQVPEGERTNFVRQRMADWFGVTDPDAQSDFARALIMAGAHIAGSSSPALTALSEGLAVGVSAFDDAQAGRAEAEREQLEQDIMLEQWAMEFEQRERDLASRQAQAQAELAADMAEDNPNIVAQMERVDFIAREMVESGLVGDLDEARGIAYQQVMGKNMPNYDMMEAMIAQMISGGREAA